MKPNEFKKEMIKSMIFILLVVSIILEINTNYLKDDSFDINFEYINIKDIAQVKVATKSNNKKNSLDNLFIGTTDTSSVNEVKMPTIGTVKETTLPTIKKLSVDNTPKRIWYLPTEMGVVSQNPHHGHVALDITSPRGSNELVFPVANGTISGIYTDRAGALIITVLHNIDGRKYTSQYVHLASYAKGLYVGKPVTINDCLGRMGSTGYSSGVHLHLAVVDCALFDHNDRNCSGLNGFFRYAEARYSQGYIGLGSMIRVPGSWNSR